MSSDVKRGYCGCILRPERLASIYQTCCARSLSSLVAPENSLVRMRFATSTEAMAAELQQGNALVKGHLLLDLRQPPWRPGLPTPTASKRQHALRRIATILPHEAAIDQCSTTTAGLEAPLHRIRDLASTSPFFSFVVV